MATLTNRITIDAPVEAAFAELSDIRNEQRWNPTMESVELLTPEPIGVGSRLRAKWARSPEAEVEYTEFDAPRLWVTRSTAGPLTIIVRLELTPSGSGQP